MRALPFSPPERVAIGIAAALLVLQAASAGTALEYQRAALFGEPWRVLTGHLVHINWPHALINAAALWLVARLFATDLDARRQVAVLVLSAVAISAALAWFYPTIAWYRGLSGALHGLFFAGSVKWLLAERPRTWQRLALPIALLLGGWIKVITEQPGGAATTHAEWLDAAVVPQAHLVGALCGALLGALFAATNPRREKQRAEQ